MKMGFMGKKVSMNRASSKIAKKQQAAMGCSNSLTMKVLRPRVYITDVTNFKQLVKELTGNSNVPSSQPILDDAHLPCPPQLPRDIITTTMIVENTDSVSISGDARIWDDFEGIMQREDTLSNHFSWELPRLESSLHLQQTQTYEQQLDNDALLTFGDIEGWLLDIDPAPSGESYAASLDLGMYDFVMGNL